MPTDSSASGWPFSGRRYVAVKVFFIVCLVVGAVMIIGGLSHISQLGYDEMNPAPRIESTLLFAGLGVFCLPGALAVIWTIRRQQRYNRTH
jgi:hypothetical protein